MRPQTTSRNSKTTSSQRTVDTRSVSNSMGSASVAGTFDLSSMLSAPIIVDMSNSLYNKINTDVQNLSNDNYNDNYIENYEEERTGSVNYSTESVEEIQPQPIVAQPAETFRPQPVRHSTREVREEQPRQIYQNTSDYRELPVLATIPDLSKCNNQSRRESQVNFETLREQVISGREAVRSTSQTRSVPRQEGNTSERTMEQRTEQTPVNVSNTDSSTLEKREKFLSSISWGSARRLLFNRETIKLGFLTLVVCTLVIAARIYKGNRSTNGLIESDVVVSQPASLNETASNETQTPAEAESATLIPVRQDDEQVALNPVPMNQESLADPMSDGSYQSPVFESPDANGFNNPSDYSNGIPGMYAQQTPNIPMGNDNVQALPQNIPPQNIPAQNASNYATMPNNGQGYNAPNTGSVSMPQFNSSPEFAPVQPAVGNQYSPSEYESPILEEDPVDYAGNGLSNNEVR